MPSLSNASPLVLCLFLLGACGGVSGPPEPVPVATIESESAALESARRTITALAGQLASAQATRRPTTEIERQLAERRAEAARLAAQLDQHLVDFLNRHRPLPDQEVPQDVRRVLEVKVREDLAVAEEYINEGGDYPHALQIYRDLLLLVPDDARVLAAQAAAEAHRTLSPERFATLRKGMTRPQVRGALGQPHLKNIQTFEEQGVVAWFYPTSEGGTAGVYFQAENEGEPVVYRWDFAVTVGGP
jgi:hypothetical protein